MAQAVLPGAAGRCPPAAWQRQHPPPHSPCPQPRWALSLHGTFTAQVWADNGSDFPFTAALTLSAPRYHQWQGKCGEISLTVLSDIWLQTAWAYPTPPQADNFKGTGSPFSCFSCPNSSLSRALILARLFIKCIRVIMFTGLDLRRNLGFWPDKTELGWAKLLKIEVLWTFQIIFVCSWGSKIWLRSWTFPLLLLSFETSVFSKSD